MASYDRTDNAKRIRYVRLLERFFHSIKSYLTKSENPTKEKYITKIENNRKYLDRTDKMVLYKTELVELQRMVDRMLHFATTDDTIDEIIAEVLRSANKLEQSKNARNYKKDKHSNAKFDEWD